MELVYAFLASSANLSDGKLSVIDGDWDAVQVSELPGVLPPFVIVAKLRMSPGESESNHSYCVTMAAPDGHVWPPTESKLLPVKRNIRNPMRPSFSVIVATIVTALDAEGEYRVKLLADGSEVVSLPLHVTLAHAAVAEDR